MLELSGRKGRILWKQEQNKLKACAAAKAT